MIFSVSNLESTSPPPSGAGQQMTSTFGATARQFDHMQTGNTGPTTKRLHYVPEGALTPYVPVSQSHLGEGSHDFESSCVM
jgi:hypothetical protein